jgi:hypothetical protein
MENVQKAFDGYQRKPYTHCPVIDAGAIYQITK